MNTNVSNISTMAAIPNAKPIVDNSMLPDEAYHQQIPNTDLNKQLSPDRQAALDTDHPNRSAYLNSIFSNIIELPVTPSPPPLLEVDENLENESESNEVPTDDEAPRVPISHLITTNQYPSLSKIPPPNIAQSFPPLYVQPQNYQQSRQNEQPTEEIYNDYVNDPYNLTLEVEQSLYRTEPAVNASHPENQSTQNEFLSSAVSSKVPQTDSPQRPQPQSMQVQSNIFQSANYFGTPDGNIPPGSEMLFGGP